LDELGEGGRVCLAASLLHGLADEEIEEITVSGDSNAFSFESSCILKTRLTGAW